MQRRSFIKVVGAAGATTVALPAGFAAELRTGEAVERVAGVPRRQLGRTGRKVSIIGFPGLALAKVDQAASNRAVRSAFDRGINYFDVAPAYGDAEEKMGPALQGLDRGQIFLACKTKMRDAKGAREELERSLQRLKTDHFDLYQMHHVVSEEQVKQALGPGGALETFLKAKEEGKVRHFGFSAHTTKGALALMKGFNFDTAMFPISYVEYFARGFGREVLELANQQGAAVVAIKPMSMGTWPAGATKTREWWYRTTDTPREADLAIRFSLSLRGVVAGIPPSFLDLVDSALEVARNYRDMTLAEMNDLVQWAWASGSLFKREEESVAYHCPYPEHPEQSPDALA